MVGLDNCSSFVLHSVVLYYYVERKMSSMEIEWLILADFAQIIGNKLYLQGGGWDRLTVNTGFPHKRGVGVATSVCVPWGDTNTEGHLRVALANQDGEELGHFEGRFKVGRPPDLPEGSNQRIQIAGGFSAELKEPGIYVVTAHMNGEEGAIVHFNVVQGPKVQQVAS